MRFKIVLINFPFDNLANTKLRPALCLTNTISKHRHIVLAAITSKVNNELEPTDIIIQYNEATKSTGLKTTSAIKIHRLITVSENLIQQIVGRITCYFPYSVNRKIVAFI